MLDYQSSIIAALHLLYMEDVKAIYTLIIVLMMVVALYNEWLKPIAIFGITTGMLLMGNVISTHELLAGFANEQVAVIILLIIISSIIQRAGLLELGLNWMFRGANEYKRFSGRLLSFVGISSGFLNNTPIVAAFIPFVYGWSQKNGVAASKILLPLSYTAILGGTITLIGTSTNLIVNGLVEQNGLIPFELFDFIYVGIPVTIIGIMYMVFFGQKLLPNRTDALNSFNDNTREYLVETKVMLGSKLINKTVEQADLRSLSGLFLVEIIRGDRKIGPVKPTQNIREGDYLIFAGDTATIPELLDSKFGLELPKLKGIQQQELINVFEVVISYNSSLAGKKVRETNFRGKYDAAIVAIHRNGERLSGKIGDIVIQNGDLLVLLTGKDFRKRIDVGAFYLINKQTEIQNIDKKKGYILTFGALLAILLSTFNFISLFKAMLIYLCFVLVVKWVKSGDIQKGFDLNLAFIAALSLAIGQAMTNSGLAQIIAQSLMEVMGGIGPIGILIGIYILTNVLTEFVTNIAAASITLPIAIYLAQAYNLPYQPYVLAVAYAASMSFLSPIGYQTNLMVLGPGGYKFKDYIKFGLPLTILCFVTTVLVLSLKYNLWQM